MENVLGTGVEVRRDEVRVWLAQVIPALAAHALAVVWVTAAADDREISWLVVAGAAFAITTILLDAVLRRQRRLQGEAAILLRVLVAASQLLVGLWLLLVPDSDAWRFLGVTSLVMFVSAVLSEARYSTRWTHTRGRVVCGVAVLLAVLGLWPIAGISPLAGVALAGYGSLAAVVGGELVTEDWLRALPRWTPPRMRLVGGSLLGAAGLVLAWGGAHPAYVLLLLVVLALVVAAVSSDSDSGEVIVLLTVALCWAAAPRQVASIAAVEPRAGEPFFVALGDSYISGEGAERFFEGTNDTQGNECRRAPTAHPVRLARTSSAELPDRVLFLACSGAVTLDIYGDRPGRTEPVSQLDQYAAALQHLDEGDVAFVLLSLGGNDAGFGEIGQACAGPGDCSQIGARWLERLEHVRTQLGIAYDKIDATFDVPVHVVPYPMPLATHGCWWSWLADDESRFIAGFVHELNTVIAAEAAEHGFDVVATVEAAFEADGLRICDQQWPWWPNELGMNFIAMNPTSGSLGDVVDPRNWIHNSFHPNERGHEVLAGEIAAWVTDPPPAAPPADEPAPPIAVSCSGEDPPPECSLRTSEWQGIQVRTLLRHVAPPIVVALIGAWLLVAPSLRWAAEHEVSLGRALLRALGGLRTRVGAMVGR